jgi:hypothetical protein
MHHLFSLPQPTSLISNESQVVRLHKGKRFRKAAGKQSKERQGLKHIFGKTGDEGDDFYRERRWELYKKYSDAFSVEFSVRWSSYKFFCD